MYVHLGSLTTAPSESYPSTAYAESAERWSRYESMQEPKEVANRTYTRIKQDGVAEVEGALDDYAVTKTVDSMSLFMDPLDRILKAGEIEQVVTADYDVERKKPGERLLAWAKRQRDDLGRGVLVKGNPLPPPGPDPIEAKATKYVEPAFDIRTLAGIALYEPKGGWKLLSEATTLSYVTSFVRSYWPWLALSAAGLGAAIYYVRKRH